MSQHAVAMVKAMTYKQAITFAMTELAADPAVCFVGYGITHGKAMGTLANVNPAQLIETPVAENLMVGLATGLALRGRKPVVFIERCDFLLNAMDAIVNHLVKIDLMSRGEFKPAIILRIVVGNSQKPLFTGETHIQDFSDVLWRMTGRNMETIALRHSNEHNHNMPHLFSGAIDSMERGISTAFFEYKDLY